MSRRCRYLGANKQVTPIALRHKSWANRRWLKPLAVFVFVFFTWTSNAGASSLTRASSFDTDEHARQCGCGTLCRGQSCCCGKKAKGQTPKPSKVPQERDWSPCVSASPCQVPGLPPVTPGGAVSKAATLAAGEVLLGSSCRDYLSLSSRCVLPERRVARLNEPPESTEVG